MDDKKCKNIHGLRNRRHIIHTSVMREVDKKEVRTTYSKDIILSWVWIQVAPLRNNDKLLDLFRLIIKFWWGQYEWNMCFLWFLMDTDMPVR